MNDKLYKCIEILNKELKSINYEDIKNSESIDMLTKGSPLIYLPILHHLFLAYSPFIAKVLSDHKYDLFSKPDLYFINKILAASINLFKYKPKITAEQFFKKEKFVEAKIIFCIEMIGVIKIEHSNLEKTYNSINNLKNRSNNISSNKKDKVSDFDDYKRINIKTEKVPIKVIDHRKEIKRYIENDQQNQEILVSPKFNECMINDFENKSNLSENEQSFGSDNVNENKYAIQSFRNINLENNITKENNLLNEDWKKDNKDSIEFTYNNQNNRYNSKNEMTAVINIINELASSVKDMTKKIDNFKDNIENRVSVLESEIIIIKNNLHYFEAQKSIKEINKGYNNNEVIFSFAGSESQEISLDKKDYDLHNKKLNTISNSNNKRAIKINDADSIIERVANRFKETQKLLSEFK